MPHLAHFTFLSSPFTHYYCNSTYDDLCTLLEKIPLTPSGQCPAPLPQYDVPCRCPIGAGKWSVPSVTVAVPKLPPSVPTWLTSVSAFFCFVLKLNYCSSVE